MKKLLFSLLYAFTVASGIMCQAAETKKNPYAANGGTFLHFLAEYCNHGSYQELVENETKGLTDEQIAALYNETDPRLTDNNGNKAFDIAFNNSYGEIAKAQAGGSYNHDYKNICLPMATLFKHLEHQFNKKEALEKQQQKE